ncbi:MAG: ribosome small subunit-dependent GTPase A, partial [Clostridia bacterium]|nr:ribosome small subunit-dependent GTPase A [Clostridia bacterium]
RIYSACGFEVFRTGIGGEGSDELRRRLKGALAVFAGASGVGKSSLLNRLYPQFKAQTGELSAKIARGKNTTRHTELFATGDGGYIADTPGFSALDPKTEDLLVFDDLEYCFPEFEPFSGKCRFRGCGHTTEIGCAVIDAVGRGEIPVSRHESYKKLFEVLKKKTQY